MRFLMGVLVAASFVITTCAGCGDKPASKPAKSGPALAPGSESDAPGTPAKTGTTPKGIRGGMGDGDEE
jgi:hypothetical protein